MAAEAIGLTASLIAISELCVKSIASYRTVKDATKDRALAAEIQFCKALIDELQNASAAMYGRRRWRQAVNQQQVEAQMGIDEVRGKTIKRVLSECLTSKMKELCGKWGGGGGKSAKQQGQVYHDVWEMDGSLSALDV